MILGVLPVTLLAAILLSRLAPKIGLLAQPGAHRHHQQPTPLVGGLAIYVGFLYACLVVDRSLISLLPSLSLLCLTGALDDRFKLASGLRIIVQGVAAVMMIRYSGIELLSLGNLFSQDEVLLGRWSLALTVFATIGVINAINMSDGMDGLAGGLLLFIFSIVWFLGGQPQSLALACCLAVLVFLCFNIRLRQRPARIFMGDAGSTMLGFLVAYFLILNSQGDQALIKPVTALWIVALPLIDAVAVLLIRPIRGQSPFSADRIHYHHLILVKGFSVNQTLLIVLAVQAVMTIASLAAERAGVSTHIMFYLFALLFAAYLLMLYRVTHSVGQKRN